jgi:acylpyruvate hydrolase
VRLVSARIDGSTRAARVEGDELVVLDHPDVGALLASGPDWQSAAGADGERIFAAGVPLTTLLPAPEKIICVGLNYHGHAAETGLGVPDFPTLFAKYSRALLGPEDDIVLPDASVKVDWEAELAVVVGREVRHADEDEARAAIGGYTVANDISMRDWQGRTRQWLQGKTFEASTPVGPALVTPDEIDDADDLRVTCTVDGETVQDSSTSDFVFGPTALIAYISTIVTLVPGDLIITGTPSGIGAARKPPRFLAPGQVVRTTVAQVGELQNTCVAPGADGKG